MNTPDTLSFEVMFLSNFPLPALCYLAHKYEIAGLGLYTVIITVYSHKPACMYVTGER